MAVMTPLLEMGGVRSSSPLAPFVATPLIVSVAVPLTVSHQSPLLMVAGLPGV
jgi:hypothetical protein